MRGYSISRKLFREYLTRPYAFFLGTNTAELSRNVLTEVNNLIVNLLMPLLEALSRGVVALSIVAFLLVLNPLVAGAVMVVLGGLYGSIYAVTRVKLRDFGRDRLAANMGRFKVTGEAFGSIKDVKLLQSERHFDEAFSEQAHIYALRDSASLMIGQLPRYALEAIAFCGIVVVVLASLALSKDFTHIVPFISAYAVATYKLMPALQTIIRDVTKVRYYMPTLAVIGKELPTSRVELPPPAGELPAVELIELRNVGYVYAERNEAAVQGINLQIVPPTHVGICRRNRQRKDDARRYPRRAALRSGRRGLCQRCETHGYERKAVAEEIRICAPDDFAPRRHGNAQHCVWRQL